VLHISDADLDRLIAEDFSTGDLTTAALGIGAEPAIMRFAARGAMVACAVEEAARLLARLGARVDLLARSGQTMADGASLLTAHGSADALLAGWKVAQTLVEWASGIASATDAIARTARAVRPDIAVACTRKTAPLTRQLSIKAVLAGGGTMHRTGLGETVLVFPEHRALMGDISDAEIVARLRGRAPERKLVFEVKTVDAALRAKAAGVDVLQLEKFSPDAVARVCAALVGMPQRPIVAAAGGVNAANAHAYAEAGADVLVTSAPYSAPPRDVQVTLTHASNEP
jgi:molybdenum transport protein